MRYNITLQHVVILSYYTKHLYIEIWYKMFIYWDIKQNMYILIYYKKHVHIEILYEMQIYVKTSNKRENFISLLWKLTKSIHLKVSDSIPLSMVCIVWTHQMILTLRGCSSIMWSYFNEKIHWIMNPEKMFIVHQCFLFPPLCLSYFISLSSGDLWFQYKKIYFCKAIFLR